MSSARAGPPVSIWSSWAATVFTNWPPPEEQAQCIRLAATALKPGGHVYIDNDHMEGELDPTWQDIGVPEKRGFQGLCADGCRVESFMETIWLDAPQRLVRFRRWSEITASGGAKLMREFIQQKHPVSMGEVRGWLEQCGFTIEHLFGNRQGAHIQKMRNERYSGR